MEVKMIVRIIADPTTSTVSQVSRAPTTHATTHEYVHMFAARISDANKKGVDSLSYWRNGFKAQKAYILNEALAQYLAQYPESQQPIPPEERKG